MPWLVIGARSSEGLTSTTSITIDLLGVTLHRRELIYFMQVSFVIVEFHRDWVFGF